MVTATRTKIEKKDEQATAAAARAWAVKISPSSNESCASKNKVQRHQQHAEADRPQVAAAATTCAQWRWRQRCWWSGRRRHANADHKEKQSSTTTSAHCQSERASSSPSAACDERRQLQELSSRIISIELACALAGATNITATAAHATHTANGARDLTDDKIIVPARSGPRHAPLAMPEKDRRKGTGASGLLATTTPNLATRMDTKFLFPLLLLLSLFTLFLVTMFAPAMDCYQVTADAGRASSRPWPPRLVPNEPVRGVGNQEQRHRWPHRRSLFGSAGGEPSPELAPGAQGQDIVPYQTYYVTQACEWKSNLFVPKSNDILFAQPQRVLVQPLADQRQQFPEVESSSGPFEDASSRTIFSTTNKALILALPPISHATFAGYEPACSIRLIVPRNMRILAKLTARRLTFEQELQPNTAQLEPTAVAPLGFGALGAEPTAPAGQLWLNVSQNQFSETEQKTIETEGNVLAFRFLLERFASLREPDIRLQVVLTAFQTWGENSDTGLAVGQPPTQSGDQLICDSGRLISANLACDGFRNCLDGQDEEPASCAALRQQQQQQQQQQGTTPHLSSFNQTKPSTSQTTGGGGPSNRWAPARVLNWIARDASPLVALLAGLLLLLLLLFCCTCCCYCLMLLVRKATANVQDDSDTSRRRVRRRLAALKLLDAEASGGGGQAGRDGEDLETDSLARGQNLENAARLKAARGLLEGGGTSTNQQQQQPLVAGQVRQIQSILKRPMVSGSGGGQQLPTSVSYKGVAPLARFESIPTLGSDPPPPPPRASAANRKSTTDAQQQHPSPRRGALADSLTSARSSGRSFPDFRPTPATRAGGKREPSSAATSALRSQPSSSGTSRPGAPQVGVAQPVRPTTSSAGREGQQQQPRAPAAGETSGFALESRTTKLEQTSTSTGNGERLTVYQYSSNLAQYSESYLLREQQQQRHASGSSPGATLLVTGARVAPSSSTVANDNPKDEDDEAPELPPKSRQSSLI